jgi:hypothetical protein
MPASEVLVAVRGSVARTRAERTAVLRYRTGRPARLGNPPTRRGLPALWGGGRRPGSLERGSEVLGAIDFERRRSVHYESGTGWSIYEPGREVVGEDDEWEEPLSEGYAIGSEQPLWLIELVAGALEAELLVVDRSGLRRYSLIASVAGASAAAGISLAPDNRAPNEPSDDQVRLGLWLDDAGRIRSVARAGDDRSNVVELGDFGAPVTIEFPAPQRIWRASDQPAPDPPQAPTGVPSDPGHDEVGSADADGAGVMEAAVAAQVRAACELTTSLGTARITYDTDLKSSVMARVVDFVSEEGPTPPPSKAVGAVWSLVGRGVKAVERGLAQNLSGSRDGVADFRAGACLVRGKNSGSDDEMLFLPGRTVAHRHGRWRQTSSRPFVGAAQYTPIWLIELLRGATRATIVDHETIAGLVCRHVKGTADRREASRRSTHGISLSIGGRVADRPAQFEAWIDADGQLRRVRCTPSMPDPEDASKPWATGAFAVTLTDLGGAPAPEVPPPDEIGANELLVPRSAIAIVRSWARRLPEILPPDIALAYDDGLIFTLAHRPSGRTSSVQLQTTTMIIPGTSAEKLEHTYAVHGRDLQALISEMNGADWPERGARIHVVVTGDDIRVQWSSPKRRSVALPAIPRSEIGL